MRTAGDRVLSIDLKQIRQIHQVIGVVAGGDRSAAITVAIRGGLIKALLIDDAAAGFLCITFRPVACGKCKASGQS